MFGPLEFIDENDQTDQGNVNNNVPVLCILCDLTFIFPGQQENCLSHIYESHHLIISDVEKISDLHKYLKFWRYHFSVSNIKEFCSTMLVDVNRDGVLSKGEEFFLLSDILPMDKELRKGLKKESLEAALEQQKLEREDRAFERGCLFCRKAIGSTRAEYLEHLSSKHNLYFGRPENLVYIDKMISLVEKKLEDLQCIYCEKFFKDRNILKEHMRKKFHKRINPKNKLYDQFYIINYLESNKDRKSPSSSKVIEDDDCWKGEASEGSGSEGEGGDWSDWGETFEVSLVCLFCPKASRSWEAVVHHMDAEHRFHYEKSAAHLSFYDQVKLVNYIRRQVFKNKCITCDVEKPNNTELLDHMEGENHIAVPEKNLWNHPEFYFPTYENDAFLCQIEDQNGSDSELSDVMCEMSLSNSSGQFDNAEEEGMGA